MHHRFKFLASVVLLFTATFACPLSTATAGYWDTEIPLIKGAGNVVKEKDPDKATISTSFDVVLEEFKAPLKFYDDFLRSIGFTHQMDEVYAKYPTQFERPPSEQWSSFSARSENGSYQLLFGSQWENKANGSNATVTMRLFSINKDALNAHIEIVIGPSIDGSAFLKLVELTRDDPKSLLRLAAIAGGDPFDIDKVDIRAVRSVAAKDDLTRLYLDAIDSVMAQISKFAVKNLPPK